MLKVSALTGAQPRGATQKAYLQRCLPKLPECGRNSAWQVVYCAPRRGGGGPGPPPHLLLPVQRLER